MTDRPPPTGPLFLLDGMSLAYRAWFALPPDLATKDGAVTNAVHGFVSMLVYVVREHRPSALAVAFDLPGATFRDELVADYKAGRPETPGDLLPQFEMIREVLSVLAVPVVEVPGYEADDVLATLATEARDRDCDVVVVTGDRDAYQLVEDPHVRVLYNRRGVSDYALYDEAGILERTGVTPAKYPMLAALRGDASDNLPGVPGVGEKTAARLINTYGDLDGIFAHLAELSPKLRENLAAHEAQARSNAAVTLLVRDVPLPVRVADLDLGGWDLDVARATFDRLELRTVWRRLVGLLEDGALGSPAPGTRRPVLGAESSDPDGTLTVVAVAEAPVRAPVPDAGGPASAAVAGTVARVVLEVDHPGTEGDAVDGLADLAGRVGSGLLAVAGRWTGCRDAPRCEAWPWSPGSRPSGPCGWRPACSSRRASGRPWVR